MKALVIGYGSIGRRHVRLVGELGLSVAVVSRRDVDADVLYATIAEAVDAFKPDYVVVASRTSEHRKDIATLADCGFKGTLLVEKPVYDTGSEAVDPRFAAVFVAYNLRFHPVIRRFKEILDTTKPFAVQAYVGQYLPDWRPETDYRQGYSAIKALGGGVLRDLSHELDCLNWMLGGWTRLTALGGHFSDLEIDSDDVFSLLFETRRCRAVSVQLNYLDSTVRREILALTDCGSLHADLVRGTVEFADERETFASARDDTYLAQHRAVIAGDTDALCSIDEGLTVMGMIDAAETATVDGVWVGA